MSVPKLHTRQTSFSGLETQRIPNRVTAWRQDVNCIHIMEKASETAEWEAGAAPELVLTG